MSFRISDETQLQHYRFALGTADFLLCRRCGVYLAAVLASPRGRFAIVNINVIRGVLDAAQADPISYDGESPAQRQQRRERNWTPVIEAA